MAYAIRVWVGEAERLYHSLHSLSLDTSYAVKPERALSFPERAKELSDQVWRPDGEFESCEIQADNFDLWVIFNAAMFAEPELQRISDIALDHHSEPQHMKTDPREHPTWSKNRRRALQRDGQKCTECGISQSDHRSKYDTELHVHHIKQASEFTDPAKANELENLLVLCRPCHNRRHSSGTPRDEKVNA